MSFDVVVVGAGVNGASVAANLALKGIQRTALLDVRGAGSGTTSASAAIITTHHATLAEVALAHDGLRLFEKLSDFTSDGLGFRPVGVAHIVSNRFANDLSRVVSLQRRVGVEVEVLRPDAHAISLPGLKLADDETVVLEAKAGYADPADTVHALVDVACQHGAELREGCEVRRILLGRGCVRGVETVAGTIEAPVVVIAAGNGSKQLLRSVGCELPVSPRRVQIAALERPRSTLPSCVVVDTVNGSWIKAHGGEILVGLELPLSTDQASVQAGRGVADAWYAELCRRLIGARAPAVSHAPTRHAWSGVISMTPDAKPVIDAVDPFRGLFCIAGDSGRNFKTALAVGRAVSEWVVDGDPTSSCLAEFRLSRFRDGPPEPTRHYGSQAVTTRLVRAMHSLEELGGAEGVEKRQGTIL